MREVILDPLWALLREYHANIAAREFLEIGVVQRFVR